MALICIFLKLVMLRILCLSLLKMSYVPGSGRRSKTFIHTMDNDSVIEREKVMCTDMNLSIMYTVSAEQNQIVEVYIYIRTPWVASGRQPRETSLIRNRAYYGSSIVIRTRRVLE